jgi:MFS family permease
MTDSFEERSWGKAIAIHDSGTSVSVFAAPLIAVFLLGFFPWRGIFYVFGTVYALCGSLFFFACSELKATKRLKGYTGSLLSSLLKSKSLWILAVIWVFAAGAFWAVYMIIPLYLTKELSFDIGYANTLFGISRIGGVVVGIVTGFVVDRFSLKKTMFVILFVSGIFMLFISHWNMRVVEIGLFLQGSLIAGFFPIGLVSLSRMFDKERRSMATGFIATLSSIVGAGVFPYLLGLAGDFLSFRFGIFAFGMLAIFSSGLVYFLKEID